MKTLPTGTRVKLERPLVEASGYKPIQDVPIGSTGTVETEIRSQDGFVTSYTIEWDDPALGKHAFDPTSGHRVLLKIEDVLP